MSTPTVYIVHWPHGDVFKIGYSAVRRWRRFEFSGADVLKLYEFDSAADAYAIEDLLHETARNAHRRAFQAATREVVDLLGNKGAGYLECYRGSAADALSIATRALLDASAQTEGVAMLPGNGTYVRTNVLTKSVVTLARYQDFRNAHARIRIAEVDR